MQIELRDHLNNFVCALSNDNECLASYGVQPDQTLHVIDSQPNSMLLDLEDDSQVQKYEISNEDYNKRTDTFRNFKKDLIKNNPHLL